MQIPIRSKLPRAGAAMIALAGITTAALALAHDGKTHRSVGRPSAAEIAAFKVAEPVFARHCYRCHTQGGKKSKAKTLAHLDMSRYPFTGHHAAEAGTAVRKVLGAPGEKATMPKDDPGAVSAEALSKVLGWADAFDRAHANDGGDPHQP